MENGLENKVFKT